MGLTKNSDNQAVDELQGLMPGNRNDRNAGERTLDKAFASLGWLERVQTQWDKQGERLYRLG